MPVTGNVSTSQIRTLVQDKKLRDLGALLHESSTAQIVDIIESLPISEATIVFRMLAKDKAIDVFEDLDTHDQADIIKELGDAPLAEIFDALEADDQARLLDELPAKVARRVIGEFSGSELDAAMVLLGYPKNSLGRHTSPEPVLARDTGVVGDVLDQLAVSDSDHDRLSEIPVVSSKRVLVGTLDPFELLRVPRDTPLVDVMEHEPLLAHTRDNAEEVARWVLDDGILVLPVVDSERRLVGIFPISDAAKIDKAAVDEDQARAGASEPLRRPYLLTSVLSMTRARIVWLLVLAISAVLTVQVLEMFEATLAQKVALALFIPLLTGIGGNTGSQAATTVTRALALGDVRPRDAWRVAFKEVRTGLLLGLLLGALAFAIASLFYGTGIGTVIGLTLLLNLPLAATVGGVVPLAARACRVDPAVVSTPFISTFCDATGLLVYFTVAITVLGLST